MKLRFKKKSAKTAGLAPGIDIPALFLMANRDQVVPMRFARKLAAGWGGPVTSVTIDGADHNSIHLPSVYWDAINRFLLSLGR